MNPFINVHTHQTDYNIGHIGIVDWGTATIAQRKNIKFFSAGIHPWYIAIADTEHQFQQLNTIATLPDCKAIGECGLDRLKGVELSVQYKIFEKQIDLAIELKKPIIVHCVQAYDVLSSILKKYQGKAVFIIHGFNQNAQIANQLVQLGAYLSFGDALLNSKQERLKLIFEQTPNEKIFLENDNSESSIQAIYEVAANIKKRELGVMKEIIFANYKTVFKHE